MSAETVARRYASALADVLIEREETSDVLAEIRAWEEMLLSHARLLESFTNPTIAYEQKRKLLVELISRTKVMPVTANFLNVLLKNQRLAELPHVNAKLTQILDERAGMVSAEVTSARPVPGPTQLELEQKLGELTGKKVRLTFGTDESLLGGIVTKIGSTIYDGSVRSQLMRMGEELAG